MTRLRIEVPATSANLGPGFDALGLALQLTNVVTADLGGDDVFLDGDRDGLDAHDNLLCRAYRAWSSETGATLPGARFEVEWHIPYRKGLGSSAAAIVAGLAAAAHAAEVKEPEGRIIALGSKLEGHADNVVPATLGGITVAFQDGDAIRATHIANHLSMAAVLFVPEQGLPTTRSRGALPATVSHADAVFNIGRAAYLTAALIWGRWESIGPAMQDRLHQPYRAELIPALDDVVAAAMESGAYGAALSGGGPSVIALCPPERADEVAAGMVDTAQQCEWAGETMITGIRHRGVTVRPES